MSVTFRNHALIIKEFLFFKLVYLLYITFCLLFISEPSLADVSQEAPSVSNDVTEASDSNGQQSLQAESLVIAEAPTAAPVEAVAVDEAKSKKGDRYLGCAY